MQTSQAVSVGATFPAVGVEDSSANHLPSPPGREAAEFERHMRQSAGGWRSSAPSAAPATPSCQTHPAGIATGSDPRGEVSASQVIGPAPQRMVMLNSTAATGRLLEPHDAEPAIQIPTTPPPEPLHLEVPVEPVAGGDRDATTAELVNPEQLILPADAAVIPQRPPVPVPIQGGPVTPPPIEGETGPVQGEGGHPRPVARAATMTSAEPLPAPPPDEDKVPARTGVEVAAPRAEAQLRRVEQPLAEPAAAAQPTELEQDVAGEPLLRVNRGALDPAAEPARPQRAEPRSEATPVKDQAVAGGQRARGGEADQLRPVDVSRWPRAEAEIPLVTPALLRRASELPFSGTGAAKLERSMGRSAEQNQIAGPREQKLPPAGRSVAGGDLRPLADHAVELARGVAVERPDKAPRTAGEALAGSMLNPGAGAVSAAANGGSEVASAGTVRSAEQMLQNLTREVAQFKRYNAESMAVVLKPDAHTEIFLHLVTRNGQIDIQARFERGDFTSLSGQWAQLQQTLAQQGVRLGNLQEGFHQPSSQSQPGGSDWSEGQMQHGGQRHSGRQPGEEARVIPFEEILRTGPAGETVSRRGRGRATSSRATLEAWA